jgi:hypothetical protein
MLPVYTHSIPADYQDRLRERLHDNANGPVGVTRRRYQWLASETSPAVAPFDKAAREF